jgi:hypothetical protein
MNAYIRHREWSQWNGTINQIGSAVRNVLFFVERETDEQFQ